MRTQGEKLDCAAVEALLEPYVDGELPGEEAEVVALHLARCAACSRQRDLALAVREGLRDLPRWEAPGRVLDAVRRSAERSAGAPARSRRLRSWSAVTAAAAAVVLAVAGSVLWWHQGRTAASSRPEAAEVARAVAEVRYALGLIATTTREASVAAGRRALVEHLVRPVATALDPSAEPSTAPTTSIPAAEAAQPGGSS